jgi:hypothetical protein
MEMDIKSQSPGAAKPVTLKGQVEIHYTLVRRAGSADLSISELAMTTTSDAGPSSRFRINHEGTLDERGGQKQEVTRGTADAVALGMLNTFGAPLATIKLDDEGGEISRVPLISTGPLAVPGIIDNARVFHVRYSTEKPRWDAPVTLPMAKGEAARGRLQFEKLPAPPTAQADSPMRVKVSGTLSSNAAINGVQLKNAVYKVSGEQTYDPIARDWSAGNWKVDMAWDMVRDDKPQGSAAGTMTLTLGRLPSPK